jgi:hypothetical protein
MTDMFHINRDHILDKDNVWHEPVKEFIQQRVRLVLSSTYSHYMLHETNISVFIVTTDLKLRQTKYYLLHRQHPK